MPTVTLTPEVRAVLEASTIDSTAFTLKLPLQLARPLYEATNKVLVNAGGKWNRGKGVHVFPSDPAVKLGLVLATGKSVDEKSENQVFYTPPDIAAKVVQMAQVSGKLVLEPSAGGGALVHEIRAQGARGTVMIEKDPIVAARLAEKYNSPHDRVTCCDFLNYSTTQEFDCVVMNPPFTKNQDVKHVRHALTMLRPGGRLVAIMAGNTTRLPFTKLFQHASDICRDYQWFEVDAGAFKSSGTMVRTIIFSVKLLETVSKNALKSS